MDSARLFCAERGKQVHSLGRRQQVGILDICTSERLVIQISNTWQIITFPTQKLT